MSEDELERPIEVEEDEVDIRYRSYFKYEKYDWFISSLKVETVCDLSKIS